MVNWKDKKCLVTGSEGLIGKELVIQLEDLGANVINFDIKFGPDVTNPSDIKDILNYGSSFDYVFHLFGIKGNPKKTKERPVDFMGPMLQGDTNMILAAQEFGVKKFLYTSSIAVENPQTDRFPAWAKQTAETLIHAMRVQYPNGTQYCIVRPANVYGRFDNFYNPDAMVITSLISKAFNSPSEFLEIWGDGSQVRDFINAKDVARGMIQTMEQMPFDPVNLCSGKGVTIKQVAEIIAKETNIKVRYLPIKPLGDQKRVMKSSHKFFKPEIKIEDGIREVIKHVKTQT